jgi:hypothetical protein
MGGFISNDETKPSPTGSFLARSCLSWTGTLNVVWQIAVGITVMQLRDNSITNHRHLLSGMLVASTTLALFTFLFNMFYWGATAATRRYQELVNGRPVTETVVDYQKYVDRIARAYGDQFLTSWILAGSSFTLIWLTKLYFNEGVHDFQPLTVGFTVQQLMNYDLIKFYQTCTLGVAGMSVLIALFTGFDLFKRFALEKAGGAMGMTVVVSEGGPSAGETGAVSTLLGNVYPR